MLIEIVRNGILQCFCKTCSLPEKPAFCSSDVKSDYFSKTEPKKVHFVSTEIRCQEKTRGGVGYHVILADPVTSLKQATTPSLKKETSFEEIEQKLRAAEERRVSLEANKLATINAKLQKIEDASKKRNEQTNIFINQTKEALEKKLETHVEKRESIIMDFKMKMKEHIENVEKTRQSLGTQTNEIRIAIDEKLKTATVQRDEYIKKTLERLQNNEIQIKKNRIINTIKFRILKNNITRKMNEAVKKSKI